MGQAPVRTKDDRIQTSKNQVNKPWLRCHYALIEKSLVKYDKEWNKLANELRRYTHEYIIAISDDVAISSKSIKIHFLTQPSSRTVFSLFANGRAMLAEKGRSARLSGAAIAIEKLTREEYLAYSIRFESYAPVERRGNDS